MDRRCARRLSLTVSIRSAKRDPSALCEPNDPLRQSTPIATPRQSVDGSARIRAERLQVPVSVQRGRTRISKIIRPSDRRRTSRKLRSGGSSRRTKRATAA